MALTLRALKASTHLALAPVAAIRSFRMINLPPPLTR